MNDHYNIIREDMRKKVDEALAFSGNLYTFDDIMEAIEDGRMQSFAHGDTWVVTQVDHFPRITVLNITLAVGGIEDCKAILPQLYDYCRDIGATRITGFGREGWWHFAEPGWKRLGVTYYKDLEDGS